MNKKIFASEKIISAFVQKADNLLQTVQKSIDTLLATPEIRQKQKIYLQALKKSGVQVFAQTEKIDFVEASFVHEAGTY